MTNIAGKCEIITVYSSPTTTLHTKTEAHIDDEWLLELRWRRRSVQATRGVCPLPTAFRPRGGKATGDRRRRIRRSIDVGGRRGETADCEDDDEDDDHHRRSPPPAPPSAEPWPRADDRAGGCGGRRHRRQRAEVAAGGARTA